MLPVFPSVPNANIPLWYQRVGLLIFHSRMRDGETAGESVYRGAYPLLTPPHTRGREKTISLLVTALPGVATPSLRVITMGAL